ncbi:alpha-2,3-sialyltransferase, partial [Campylobacter jejuni]|nr:alpha-2,3-sialyltransferase [Campylobacter jejuni]
FSTYKKLSKNHKNLAKNNANLEDFSDHEKALKYKNHLSYKLGNALIKAHKTWYKCGYLKFYFDIKKIKKEFNSSL